MTVPTTKSVHCVCDAMTSREPVSVTISVTVVVEHVPVVAAATGVDVVAAGHTYPLGATQLVMVSVTASVHCDCDAITSKEADAVIVSVSVTVTQEPVVAAAGGSVVVGQA